MARRASPAGAHGSGKNQVSLQRQRGYGSSTDTPDLTQPVLVFMGPLDATQPGGWATLADLPWEDK